MNHDRVTLQITPAPAVLDGVAARRHFEATQTLITNLSGLLASESGATIALDFSAHDQQIAITINAPADWQAALTHHLYAAWPSAEIVSVDQWRGRRTPAFLAATVQFAPYDGELREIDFAAGDPLAGLLEVLGAVPESSRLSARLILAGAHAKSSLAGNVVNGLGDLFVGSARHLILGPPAETAPESAKPEDAKSDHAPLRANLRLMAVAGSETAAEALIRRGAGTFHAYTAPGKSKLRYRIIKKTARSRNAGDSHELDYKSAFLLTPAEVAGLFHLPLEPRHWPRLEILETTRLPIPPGLPEAGITIGHGAHRDQRPPVRLAPADRLRHTYIIGQTGTGKSTLLQSAMLQDIQNGDGACFIDPHGEAIDWLLPRIPPERSRDVILFDPSDPQGLLGLNLLEWRTPDERDLLIQELIALFYKLFDPTRSGIIGPQFEHWLRSAALTITEPGVRGTLLDIPRLFTDPRFQEAAVAKSAHPAVRDFWLGQMAKTADFHKSEMLNYFTSKFGSFLGNAVMSEILSARASAFDMRTLMDRRKILLVNLSKGRLGSLNAQLLGTLLVTKLQLAALSRADVPPDQRPPFYVYIDEFQNIVTDSFATMLSEVRKYGLALHLAHQYVDQLPESLKAAVLGNVGTLAAFRLGTADARWLEPHFAPLSAGDLTNLPTGYFHLRTLAKGQPTAPFTVATARLETVAHPELAETIRGRVRQFVAATRNPQLASAQTRQ